MRKIRCEVAEARDKLERLAGSSDPDRLDGLRSRLWRAPWREVASATHKVLLSAADSWCTKLRQAAVEGGTNYHGEETAVPMEPEAEFDAWKATTQGAVELAEREVMLIFLAYVKEFPSAEPHFKEAAQEGSEALREAVEQIDDLEVLERLLREGFNP